MAINNTELRISRAYPYFITALLIGILFLLCVSAHGAKNIFQRSFLLFTIPVLLHLSYLIFSLFFAGKREAIDAADQYEGYMGGNMCSLVIAAKNEDFSRLLSVISSAKESVPKFKSIFLVDNDSKEDYAEEYANFDSDECRVLYAPPSPMRQFGAQLMAARKAQTEWLAIIDADYIISDQWIAEAFGELSRSNADAVGFPQQYEDDGKAVTRWANALLKYEFFVENPYRIHANAHTISGTMIVVKRELFIEYYTALRRAPFTADFGFALWLHGKKKSIAVEIRLSEGSSQ